MAEIRPPQRVDRFDYTPEHVQNWFVRFFGSIRFGLSILFLILVASSVGELLPADPENNLAFKLVFKSWWYRGLLAFQVLNLILNTFLTYVETTYPQFLPIFLDRSENYKPLKIKRKVKFKSAAASSSSAMTKALADIFSRRGYRTFFDGKSFYGYRGLIARFGSTVTHLGLITILIGALAESFLKVEGYVDMVEGETIRNYRLADDPPNEPAGHELGFEITCLDFEFIEYPGSGSEPGRGTAQKYKSSLRFSGDSPEPVHDFVRVNHKVAYGGWVFHQNSFMGSHLQRGALDQFQRYFVGLRQTLPSGEEQIHDFETYLTPGRREVTPLPGHADLFLTVEPDEAGRSAIWTVSSNSAILSRGTKSLFGDLKIEVERFFPHLTIDERGIALNLSNEPKNPAALVVISSENTVVFRDWVLSAQNRAPDPNSGAPIDLILTDFDMGGLDPAELSASSEGLATLQMNSQVTIAFRDLETGKASPQKFTLRPGETVPLVSDQERRFDIPGDFSLEVFRRTPTYVTTLSVSKNPGIPVVWLGAILASFGPFIAFFVSRRRVWAHIDWEGKQIWIGGESRYSREALEDEIAEAAAQWSTSGEVGLDPPMEIPGKKKVEVLSRHL